MTTMPLVGLELVVPPAEPLLSLDEAKEHLRVSHNADDAVITAYVAAATRAAEMYVERAFVSRTYVLWLDDWPGAELLLPMPPLASVEEIRWIDDEDNEDVVDPAVYFVDVKSAPGRVLLNRGYGWPAGGLRLANGVWVRYLAGYGAAAAVPEDIRNAVRLLTGHFYENREAVVATGAVPKELPFAVGALLNPYRMGVI